MKQNLLSTLSFFTFILITCTGCKTTGYSNALKDETADMKIKEKSDAKISKGLQLIGMMLR